MVKLHEKRVDIASVLTISWKPCVFFYFFSFALLTSRDKRGGYKLGLFLLQDSQVRRKDSRRRY